MVALLIGTFIVPLAMGEAPGWGTQPVVTALTTLAPLALPVCMGVAVLKYRLYELNRVISRVVSYALITALLAGVYAGLILLATRVLPVRTPVAVATATLVIAALFNPLRRRVQHLVDRQFNRSRYDAEAVVAAFAGRLRHTVDLDTVRRDLLGVTETAFQPAHVSLWIAPAPAGEQRPAVAAKSELSHRQCVPSPAGRHLRHIAEPQRARNAAVSGVLRDRLLRDRPSGHPGLQAPRPAGALAAREEIWTIPCPARGMLWH